MDDANREDFDQNPYRPPESLLDEPAQAEPEPSYSPYGYLEPAARTKAIVVLYAVALVLNFLDVLLILVFRKDLSAVLGDGPAFGITETQHQIDGLLPLPDVQSSAGEDPGGCGRVDGGVLGEQQQVPRRDLPGVQRFQHRVVE